MSRSGVLRVGDVRSITQLLGQCREQGDDHTVWREHLLAGLAGLVDAEHACTGEMAGCHSLDLKDLGVVFRFQVDRPPMAEEDLEFLIDPRNWPAQVAYHRRNVPGGTCLARTDFLDDRTWRATADFRLPRELFGVDHRLWCFRPIPGAGPDEHIGTLLYRETGRRDFARRDRAVVALAFELLAPLIGGPLARFSEPSPLGLPAKTRSVLACLLEGDSDKQVALRLKMTSHTVNAHTRSIYRHFGVKSRVELMARWIRRGWGAGLSRAES